MLTCGILSAALISSLIPHLIHLIPHPKVFKGQITKVGTREPNRKSLHRGTCVWANPSTDVTCFSSPWLAFTKSGFISSITPRGIKASSVRRRHVGASLDLAPKKIETTVIRLVLDWRSPAAFASVERLIALGEDAMMLMAPMASK